MAYKQLRSPDLGTTDFSGWCLRLVLHAYGFNTGAEFARQEWDRNPTKHSDPLPSDVAVPVFYSWYGTIDGVTRDWGDVAIYVPGRGVFGTPQRGAGNSNRWDSSVEARRAWLGGGAQYLGWTEQLNSTALIQLTSAQSAGGSQVFNSDEEIQEAYLLLRGDPGTAGERAGWMGQPKQRFFQIGKGEADDYRRERDSLRSQLASVQQALANEQAKPPKEVVKEVTKIVEKPVEVVKVETKYVHDEETKQNVNTILKFVTSIYNYFAGQFKSFKKYK